MSDMASFGIGGGRIDARKAESILDNAKEFAAKSGVEILLMDANLVFGRNHLESAVEHAFRAFERGTNVATAKMLEVMLYASGERQLSTAIKKLGVKGTTRCLAIVVSDQSKLDEVMERLQITKDGTVLNGNTENLISFGISREAISGTSGDKVMDLVLEKVALVDLLK